MTLDEFWNLIEGARLATATVSDIPNWLVDHLSQLPDAEIVSFRSHLEGCRHRAYDAKLWLAASVIRGGCSDDTFDDFRGWLVAQGKDVFETALVNPDSLAALQSFDGTDGYPELFRMFGVDVHAYRKRNGRGLPDVELLDRYQAICNELPRQVLKNEELMAVSDQDARVLFPKLAAKFPEGIVGEQLRKYDQGS